MAQSKELLVVNKASRRRRWRETVLDVLSNGLDSELGILLIAVAFVLISPWTIAKLARLALRTSDSKNSKHLRRRIVIGLTVNIGFWALAALVAIILAVVFRIQQ